KVYDGSCALGPGIVLSDVEPLRDLPIQIVIERNSQRVFEGETRSSRIKRGLEELAGYLFRELSFPAGAYLLTGTGIVPPAEFSMQRGDVVRIRIAELELENPVS
ncbi:MAG TPA: fumarylacetoacetate hydrolase family protein, partial [Polyangiaceae bacterium]|nr:fumarylacetoacetate hydrolase family protein [Polyangiaceae bacterium]